VGKSVFTSTTSLQGALNKFKRGFTSTTSVQGALNKSVDCGQKGIYFNYFSSRCIKQIRTLWAKGDLLQLLLFKVH